MEGKEEEYINIQQMKQFSSEVGKLSKPSTPEMQNFKIEFGC
jgi:hypothetical protein